MEGSNENVLVTWDEKLSVGDADMDSDHKKLFKLINWLYASLRAKRGNEYVQEFLDNLKEYTEYHFHAEEILMEKIKYPGLEAQKSEHRKFLEKILVLEKRWQSGDQFVPTEMRDFLQVWMVDHIMKMDKQYAVYIK